AFELRHRLRGNVEDTVAGERWRFGKELVRSRGLVEPEARKGCLVVAPGLDQQLVEPVDVAAVAADIEIMRKSAADEAAFFAGDAEAQGGAACGGRLPYLRRHAAEVVFTVPVVADHIAGFTREGQQGCLCCHINRIEVINKYNTIPVGRFEGRLAVVQCRFAVR